MCFQFLTHEDLSNGTGEQSTSAMKTPVKLSPPTVVTRIDDGGVKVADLNRPERMCL